MTDVLHQFFDILLDAYQSTGALAAAGSIPSATLWALSCVPSLTYDLNSIAWAISAGLAMLSTPIAVITALQCVWALAAIGPARKTLSTLFILLLWPAVPLLAMVLLMALWAVLGLLVMAFIVLLPLVLVIWAHCYYLPAAAKWREEERRRTPPDGVEDISFVELALAIAVAAVSTCTTAPLVAGLALLKSPLVFLSVTLQASIRVLKHMCELVVNSRDCAFTAALFVPPCFLIALAAILLGVAIGTALSIIVKIVGAVLWPGYVACGWLRTLGSRRQRRGCGAIVYQSCQAAYQVVWWSDVVTNAAISNQPELARKALEELVAIASGVRRELSHEVQRVSCLPAVVIGVLARDGAWRVDVARIALEWHVDREALEVAWERFFAQMNEVGRRMIHRGLLSSEYLSECPPALLIGLPALVLYEAIARSPRGQDTLEFVDGVRITEASRPRSAFADAAWQRLMEAKSAHEAAVVGGALDGGGGALEAIMLAGGAPIDELPALLAAAVVTATGEDQATPLPPLLAAIHKPLFALAYEMAQQPVYKKNFAALVYEPLSEYSGGGAAAQVGRQSDYVAMP